ncbi:MAG: alpha-glucan family phosphorylase, partial [Bdellovibrionales bacterium]|nr:alpha-glucan family phosphorylase [Bdellovibrionales bacterium]
VKSKCVFTTHTPVPAGHDKFPLSLASRVLGDRPLCLSDTDICTDDMLNMTHLGFTFSKYINGVAKRHGDVSQKMFSHYTVDAITNGVHASTWVSDPFAALFDLHIPGWRQDNWSLRYAVALPLQELWNAHFQAKQALLDCVLERSGVQLSPDVLTLGFARRMTPYKRAGLVFTDLERLRAIGRDRGGLQIIFAGKAHPRDEGGKDLIRFIFESRSHLGDDVKIAYVENYDMNIGKLITSGVDVWLNTPRPPLEASGTSGMKAALNGVPSLSVLDGWWVEGCFEGITGWPIGSDNPDEDPGLHASEHAAHLYEQLEQKVVPTFYHDRQRFLSVMRAAIAINGSFFNTQRMVQEYVEKAYAGNFGKPLIARS